MIPPVIIEPFSNHTFSNECDATANYSAEEICRIKSQDWVNWYIADYIYARGTVYAICIFLVVFAIARWQWNRSECRGRCIKDTRTSSPRIKAVAAVRWLATRQVRIASWSSICVGNCLVLSLMGLFLLCMTVGPQPYYWPEVGWAHSPPLGTRTGWMALAILPFQMVLASKQNPIALLLNTSHERLQLYHRWMANFMLVLGLIHTFAFVRYNATAGISKMMWEMSYTYWTGVAMLVPQVWLTIGSLAPFRNRFYEFFKLTHRAIAIIFVVFFFLHCGATLTSWDYFYVLVAVYGSSLTARGLLMLKTRWRLRRSTGKGIAHVKLVAPQLLKVRILDTGLSWKAGQHFFFRFTGGGLFTSWQSHPFTVTGLSSAMGTEIVALVKVARGESRHLALLSSAQGTLHYDTWLDGPYGASVELQPKYQHVLLLGGGSGMTFISAAVNQLMAPGRLPRNVHVVASCKSANQLRAYLDLLPAALLASTKPPGEKDISIGLDPNSRCSSYTLSAHVTGTCSSSSAETDTEANEGLFQTAAQPFSPASLETHRPDLPRLIRQYAQNAAGADMAIVACGPDAFMRDVADTVAALQADIVFGRSKLRELYFRSEAYHW